MPHQKIQTLTHDSLQALARTIATNLGPGWSAEMAVDPFDVRATLQHRDGYSLGLSESFPYGRLEIRGRWPLDSERRVFAPHRVLAGTTSITVAATAEPFAIAKAITRRLLPDYVRLWGVHREQAHEADAGRIRQREYGQRLAAAAGGEWVDRNGQRHIYERLEPYTLIEVQDSGYIKLELRGVPIDLAESIVRLVKAHTDHVQAAKGREAVEQDSCRIS